MQELDRWQGLVREWELARAGWRGLADNPLWILSQRSAAHRAPRLRRSRNAALIIWGLVLLGFYGLIFSAQLITSGWPDPETLAAMFIFGFVCPLAIGTVLFCTAQLALQAQSWLGRERHDARSVQAAMLDPLAGLTLLEGRDIVLAALRRLLPLALWGSAAGALAATLVLLFIASDEGEALVALLALPLTFAGYLLPGLLSGLLLILLCFCLGLNSTAALHRSAVAILLVTHQIVMLPGGTALFVLTGISGGSEMLGFAACTLLAHLYVLASAWSGLLLVLRTRWAGAGWLLGMPVAWAGMFWACAAALGFLLAAYGSRSMPFEDELGMTVMGMLATWGSINLFSPSNVMLPFSMGMGISELGGSQLFSLPLFYLLRVALLCCLCALAYRAALYCAALRLRSSEL